MVCNNFFFLIFFNFRRGWTLELRIFDICSGSFLPGFGNKRSLPTSLNQFASLLFHLIIGTLLANKRKSDSELYNLFLDCLDMRPCNHVAAQTFFPSRHRIITLDIAACQNYPDSSILTFG